jgi:hypothetical protein
MAPPQRLKPDLFTNTYVRAEARTLQKAEFFRSLFSRSIKKENWASGPYPSKRLRRAIAFCELQSAASWALATWSPVNRCRGINSS